MPLFIGALDSGGDQPTAPGTPTATGGNGLATVAFGDNDRGTYPLFKTFSGGLKLTF